MTSLFEIFIVIYCLSGIISILYLFDVEALIKVPANDLVGYLLESCFKSIFPFLNTYIAFIKIKQTIQDVC